jgi:hypothetical protein
MLAAGETLGLGYHRHVMRRVTGLLVVGLTLATSLGRPVPTAAAAEAVLIAAGDIAGCTWTADSATAALLDRMPGTIATLGDNAYPDGTARQFRDCYGPTWGRHRERTRPSAGNHDHHTEGAAAYFDYFGSRAGPAGRGWYSYALGSWHIVVLDSNCSSVGGCGPNSAQYAWLRADLAAHRDHDVLAYWHHPRFSSGTHGPTRAMGPFWELLYAEGADVVLNGHEHDYERFAPQDPWARADADHGIRQFVVGTGGAALRGRATRASNSQAFGTSHGVLRLTLREGAYDWSFEPVAGSGYRDAGSASTHGRPRQTRGRTVVTAAADTFVDQARPTTAYGSSGILWSDGDTGSGSDRWTYVRFTIPSLQGAVHRAVVRLWVTNGSVDGPRLVPTAATWSNTLTWAGRPSATGPPLADAGRVETGTWLTIEVTGLIRGPGSVAFALVPTSGDGLGLSSREGLRAPRLVLETLPAGPGG